MGPDDLQARVAELEAEIRVLQTMLQSAPNFITRITPDGKFLYLNRLAPGFRMEDVIGTSVDAYVPEAFRDRAHAALHAALETRSVQQYATIGQISKDKVGHYLTRVSPVVEGEEVTSMMMIATDVSMLEEERVQLQVALDAGGLGIWTCSFLDQKVVLDLQSCRIFGVSHDTSAISTEELLSKYIHADDRELVASAIEHARTTGTYGPLQHRIVRQSGEVRWVSASGLALRDHEGKIVTIVGSTQDVTQRRLLEERLLDAQRLESIGRLAGGVAHDFNNMLTATFGNLEFVDEAESLDEVRSLLAAVRVTAERSAALTAQLLAFARRQVIQLRVIDPNALIRRLDTVFQRAIGEHVCVVLSLAARGRVRAGESQLEQVVMNLVTNARDAMSSGGVLTLETLDVALDQHYADRHADVVPGQYVLVRVSDTGPGIPPHALPHIFEPFFTTRVGGTGLGLATAYGIVKQSGGHLSVHSELGGGSTFNVYLPRVDDEVVAEPRPDVTFAPSRGERVLLVEDEAPVRAVVEHTLRKNRYQVTSASTADEALRLAESESAFDLLVSDVVLPGMGGRALSERLAERMPGLRLLFISGYTEAPTVHGGVPGIHFLQKPFLPSELLRTVQHVLSSPPPPKPGAD